MTVALMYDSCVTWHNAHVATLIFTYSKVLKFRTNNRAKELCECGNNCLVHTVEPPNKAHFNLGVGVLSFIWRLSSILREVQHILPHKALRYLPNMYL